MNLKNKNQPKVEVSEGLSEIDIKLAAKDEKKKSKLFMKIIALNIVNALLLAVLLYFVGQLPQVAGKVKDLRSEAIAAQETADAAILNSEIERNSEKINKLKGLFANAGGFSDLLTQLGAIKAEGVLTEFSFPGGTPVQNAAGNSVLSLALTFQGSQDQVNNALGRIFALPILIEPGSAELEGNRDAMILRFEGNLYIDERFASN